MQIFKTYFKILKKQMTAILIYAAMFLSITIAITASMKNDNETYKPSKVNIMVINRDGQNDLLDGFIKYLSDYVNIVKTEDNEEVIKDALFFQKVSYVLTIPEGFTKDFTVNNKVNLMKQTVPNTPEAITVDNAINNYFNMASLYLKYDPNMNYDNLNASVEQSSGHETQVNFHVKVTDQVSGSNTFNKHYFNYLGYIIISCFITGVSVVMFSFQGIDIRRRHSASPLTGRSMNFQLILSNLIFVFGYTVILIVAGYVLNKNRIMNTNTVLFWLNAAVFSLTALSISYLVGIAVSSRKAIAAISTALSLSFAFISGIFVPQEYLGAPVLKLASFTPTFWFVKVNDALETLASYRWTDLSGIFGYMAIQLGFAAAIISVALVISKRKRQQVV